MGEWIEAHRLWCEVGWYVLCTLGTVYLTYWVALPALDRAKARHMARLREEIRRLEEQEREEDHVH